MSNDLPTLFISHGAPTMAVEDVPARRFLSTLGDQFPRPRAIVIISAHWESHEIRVSSCPRPATIHDFFGFAPALYELDYPVNGALSVVAEIVEHLGASGIKVECDADRGLDHGAWMPLRLMYPDGAIPVTQLSICPDRPALFHWRVGRALAPLSRDGVLVIGSGSITHNLGEFRPPRRPGEVIPTPDYVTEFSDWVAGRVANGDSDALIAWKDMAPHAARAHPSDEHFLPLHVAIGAAGVSWRGARIHRSAMYGIISMDAYKFHSHIE